MPKIILTPLLFLICTNLTAQGINLLEEIYKPIPIELIQYQLVDSLQSYIYDFEQDTYRFRIKGKVFFQFNDVYYLFLGKDDKKLDPNKLNNEDIEKIVMEIKLGTIELKDKKKQRKFQKYYNDFCSVYSNFESQTYDVFEINRFGYGTEYYEGENSKQTFIKIEFYEDKESKEIIDDESLKDYKTYYIRFIKDKLNTTKK